MRFRQQRQFTRVPGNGLSCSDADGLNEGQLGSIRVPEGTYRFVPNLGRKLGSAAVELNQKSNTACGFRTAKPSVTP